MLLIREHGEAYREVVLPFLNGEDVNGRPDSSATRWAIDFFDRTLAEAGKYPAALEIVEERVLPFRRTVNRKAHREKWWQYGDKRPALYSAIASMERVIVMAQTSNTMLPVLVPTGQVFAGALVVFAYEDFGHFGLLSSGVHQAWAIAQGATLGSGLRYLHRDCFETFPQPPLSADVVRLGESLHEYRKGVLSARGIGLTQLYNIVNDDSATSPDIEALRELHQSLDCAVAECYGWSDVPLSHGFHGVGSQGHRWTIGPEARQELLDRLLRLNHASHERK